jgi:hypothetical protein
MKIVTNVDDASVLVELTRFCDSLSNRKTFDPNIFLQKGLLSSNIVISDINMTKVAYFLIQEGAQLNQLVLDRLQRIRPEVCKLLQEWLEEDIKDPGT